MSNYLEAKLIIKRDNDENKTFSYNVVNSNNEKIFFFDFLFRYLNKDSKTPLWNEDKKLDEEKGNLIRLILHTPKDILTGYASSGNVNSFAQTDFVLKKTDDKNKVYIPILHLVLTDFFVKSMYDGESLPNSVPRSFQIMDNSIWNYLVPLYSDKEKIEKVFYEAVESIYRNYQKHLYNLSVAKEYADLNARLASQAYLAGSHAVAVSPFIFHSESVIRQLIEQEYLTETPIIERIKSKKWRILLVDDKAVQAMANDLKENAPHQWNCKLTIIKNLLQKQFKLNENSNTGSIIPDRHFNQMNIVKGDDLYLEFKSPINEQKLTEIRSLINSTANDVDITTENVSYLPMSFEKTSELSDRVNIKCFSIDKASEIKDKIIDLSKPLKLNKLLKAFVATIWGNITRKKHSWINEADLGTTDIEVCEEKKCFLLNIQLYEGVQESEIKHIQTRLQEKISEVNGRNKSDTNIKNFSLELQELTKTNNSNSNVEKLIYKLIYTGVVANKEIKLIEEEISSIDFKLNTVYRGIKIIFPQKWNDEKKKDFENQLLNKSEFQMHAIEHSPFIIEYAETEKEAEEALRLKKYDIILLDYLLTDPTGNHYGYQLLEDISKHTKVGDDKYKLGMGPNGKFFFLFISAYSSAIYERLLAEGLNQIEDYWQIAIGACPTNTPQLFLYNLIKLMENRLEHSGILKLSPKEIYKIVESIFNPVKGAVRKNANKKYQEVLSLQYHYRKMLADVDIPEDDSIFNTKGSVLVTDFISKNVNLGGMLEHLTQLVHLTAFGTIRQWPEMWEEYNYFKGQFDAQNNVANYVDKVSTEEYQNMVAHIESYIKTLKMQ